MTRIVPDTIAPDFCLEDDAGQLVCLADYRGTKHVLLVFNRGFI